jgi:hypothetical protein
MRVRALGALVVVAALLAMGACGSSMGGLFRQYEYEEDTYLSLDGSATVYVNGSVAAMNALHGTTFDTNPNARIETDVVRQYFESPVAHVTRVSRPSRRNGRRFIHVRLDVPDIRRLGEAKPFAWSTYKFTRDDTQYTFKQLIGPPAGTAPANTGWTGEEIVAFRVHLPSKIVWHNTGADPKRGNILVWEQSLQDRLRGVPLRQDQNGPAALEARMETQSILYRTLWLFGLTFAAVAVTFALLIWWILRKGRKAAA